MKVRNSWFLFWTLYRGDEEVNRFRANIYRENRRFYGGLIKNNQNDFNLTYSKVDYPNNPQCSHLKKKQLVTFCALVTGPHLYIYLVNFFLFQTLFILVWFFFWPFSWRTRALKETNKLVCESLCVCQFLNFFASHFCALMFLLLQFLFNGGYF